MAILHKDYQGNIIEYSGSSNETLAQKNLSNITNPTINGSGLFIGPDVVVESYISSDGKT